MAKALRIEIAMAGQEEINRQFAQMSQAGQDCFNSIAKEANKVGFQNLDPTFLNAKYKEFNITGKETVNQINEIVATGTKFQQLAEAVGLVEKALMRAGLAGKALLLVFGPIGATIAIVATVLGVALVAAATKVAQGLAETEREAIKLGTSFTQLTKIIEGFGKAGIGQDKVIAGLQQLQGQIDKFTLDKVNAEFEKAKKLIAGGWGAEEQIRFLQKIAEEGFGAASEAARKFLAELNRPIRDNVTPLLEAMIRSAGSAAAIIPNLAGELQGLGTASERVRLMSEALKAIAIEAGGAANAIEPLIAAIEAMPAGAERDKAVLAGLGQEFGSLVVQALRSGKSIREAIESSRGLPEATADKARQAALAIEQLKAAAKGMFDNIPLGTLATAMDAAAQKVQATANAVNAITWSGIEQGATAFNNVGTSAGTLNTNVVNVGTAVSAMTGQWSSMESSGTTAIGSINTVLDDLIGKLNTAIGLMGQLKPGGGGGAIPDAGGFARGGLMGGRGSGTSDSNLAWLSRGEYIMPAWAVRAPGVLAFLEALRRSGGRRFARGGLVGLPAFADGGVVNTVMERFLDQIEQFIEGIVDSLNSVLKNIDDIMQKLNRLAEIVGSEKTVSWSGAARGGLMGGRGSGTSDSNLAWVSRGEHIMPARAVRQPGVLAFLEALRRSGGNLRGVLDRMGHFALGGLVGAPAFAAGGVSGMSHVTIAFPGLPPIGGLRAPGSVVDELRRAAGLAQVRSGGRKPSRYF